MPGGTSSSNSQQRRDLFRSDASAKLGQPLACQGGLLIGWAIKPGQSPAAPNGGSFYSVLNKRPSVQLHLNPSFVVSQP